MGRIERVLRWFHRIHDWAEIHPWGIGWIEKQEGYGGDSTYYAAGRIERCSICQQLRIVPDLPLYPVLVDMVQPSDVLFHHPRTLAGAE